jgi:hypothetical protein
MCDRHSSWRASSVFNLINTGFENLVFVFCEQPNKRLCTVPVDGSVFRDVVGHGGQAVLVKIDQLVQTSFSNVEC